VRYEAVNAMLLNEFLKEHRKVEELGDKARKQEALIAQQQQDFKNTIAQQQKQIEALTAGLQKVTAQVESGKSSVRLAMSRRVGLLLLCSPLAEIDERMFALYYECSPNHS
jgi:hypothetical protein